MDVVLVGFIAGFVFGGWRTGFLHRLLGIVFMALSFVVSAYFRYPVGAIASTFFKDIPPDYANLVGYAIAFPVVLAALHIGARIILGDIHPQGMTKQLDSALGAALGAVEAILILSAAVVIVDAYFGTSSSLAKTFGPGYVRDLVSAFNASETVHLLRGSTVPIVLALLGPLLPKDVNKVVETGLPGRIPFPAP
ncbi:MAG TPA: CvpA family protein [Candidatus Dormibacteraeota bacterium]|nr:CvpA family protein [Candidatus Dormibacteraeota bacterium]